MAKKNNSWFDKKQIIPILISTIALFISVWYGHQLQSPFLEEVEPDIEIYSQSIGGDLSHISAKRMVESPDYSASLELCLRNTGKEETGRIDFTIDSPLNSSQIHIENLQGHERKCETLQVWTNDDCWVKGICNIPALPKGKTTLNVSVNCEECATKKFSRTVDVCIWYDKAEECWN